jgi:hypothetical protein
MNGLENTQVLVRVSVRGHSSSGKDQINVNPFGGQLSKWLRDTAFAT